MTVAHIPEDDAGCGPRVRVAIPDSTTAPMPKTFSRLRVSNRISSLEVRVRLRLQGRMARTLMVDVNVSRLMSSYIMLRAPLWALGFG